MTALEFDTALVEKAARALWTHHFEIDWSSDTIGEAEREAWREMGRTVLTAVAPDLHVAGRPWAHCTGAGDCSEAWHVHGCYADKGQCDDPTDHPGMVEGARQVLAAVEALTERAERHRYDLDPEAVAAIARQAAARIEGRASP